MKPTLAACVLFVAAMPAFAGDYTLNFTVTIGSSVLNGKSMILKQNPANPNEWEGTANLGLANPINVWMIHHAQDNWQLTGRSQIGGPVFTIPIAGFKYGHLTYLFPIAGGVVVIPPPVNPTFQLVQFSNDPAVAFTLVAVP